MDWKKLITIFLIFSVIFAVSTISFERKSSIFRSESSDKTSLEWNIQYGFPLSFLSVNYKVVIISWLGTESLYDTGGFYFKRPNIESYKLHYTFFIDVIFWFFIIYIGFIVFKLHQLNIRAKIRSELESDRSIN